MKKVILIAIAILGIANANAQYKDSGFKVIGEVGTGISSATSTIKYGGVSVSGSAFGMLTPGVEFSLGANVMPQLFVGGGVGYDAIVGVSDFSGSEVGHEAKAFIHGRYYFSSEGNGAIADVKAGYKRNFTGDLNAADVFVGPGYMFGGKFTISAGYAGTYYDGLKLHGGALKFGIEF